MIRVNVKTEQARRAVEALARGLTPKAIDGLVGDVALESLGRLKRATPKGFTGQTRNAWQIAKPRDGVRVLFNPTQTMRWIEFGTKAHGPVVAKALFIPLTKKAFLAYGRGTKIQTASYLNRSPIFQTVVGKTKSRDIILPGTLRKGSRTGVKLKYGVDYVLAKFVKGIRAMFIAREEQKVANVRLLSAAKAYIRQLLKTP